MREIWKYLLSTNEDQILEVPREAQALTVQLQNGAPHIWFLVDPYAEKEERHIIIHKTGQPVPGSTGDYIGTYQLPIGTWVFHVFDAA